MSVDIDRLRDLASKATAQCFDTAQETTDDGWVECQVCGGEGAVELHADYCNYDGAALGVQFYGIGDEHVNAEAYYRAANPAAITELLDRLEAVEKREQALAAHVERLHMAWVDAKRCVSVVAFPALYRVEQYQHLAKRSIEKLESVVSDTPTTSLARLKAQWQAEAMDELMPAICDVADRAEIRSMRDELRRQAGGDV